MNISKYLLKSFALIFTLAFATSCNDGPVFEKMEECKLNVQFVFKKHRQALTSIPGKEADVFYNTVETVHLFVYDKESGDLVFDKTEKVANLKSASDLGIGSSSEKCYMSLQLDPGQYKMVAWCGLDDSDNNNAFSLNNDNTRAAYSVCSVKLNESGNPVNAEKYESLYQGANNDVVVTGDEPNNYVIPVELTKDTNEISVWVQHTTASFDKGDYEVIYTDANGTMRFEDNTLEGSDRLEYHPYSTSLLTSTSEYNGSTVEAGAMIAHISTSRLMAANKDDARLEIRNKEGHTVFSIPFIQYLLEMQTFTDDGQYYLDCEDTYNCSFYLNGDNGQDEDEAWIPARIIINNWVRVPDQNETLGK